ncbi:MAG: efflux RND transporter periplasmic adaptor subunit [Acidobacteriota bacterium]
MTRIKQIVMLLLIVGALAAAFYLGRSTAGREPAQKHAEESERGKESHVAEGSIVTLHPEAQAKFEFKVAQVQTRAAQRMIEATGSIQANQTRVAHIRPLARGRIEEVFVRLGDRVRAGQPLLRYDNVELGEAVGQYVAALAAIERSDSETDVAKRALERARSLVDLGAVAKAELQRREAEYRNALAETERQKAEAAQAEEKLHRFGMTHPEIHKLTAGADSDYHREASHSVLTAPFAGVVTQFNASPGESIDAEDELMTVSDLTVVWVQADLFEKDIRFVREGNTAEVRVAAQPDRVFKGRITYVGDILDPHTRTAKVRVEVPNPEGMLKVEMFATVRIPTAIMGPALMVPVDSVVKVEDHMVVFVKRQNGFDKRPVELGRQVGDWVEVTEGLEEGETVVTEGAFLLKSELKKAELGHHED